MPKRKSGTKTGAKSGPKAKQQKMSQAKTVPQAKKSPPPKRPGQQKASTSKPNWNVPSRYYVLRGDKREETNVLHWDGNSPEEAMENIEEFVSDHGLNHGDIINFGGYRDMNCYFVCKDPDSGAFTLVKNPDDSSAGYLTVPVQVLENVTDAVQKYKAVLRYIEASNHIIDFYISPKDKFLKTILKANSVPPELEFVISYTGDQFESFAARVATKEKWHQFDIKESKIADIKAFLDAHEAEGSAAFGVKVVLPDEEKLNAYKEKHSSKGKKNKYAWIGAVPDLPTGWKVETGPASQGSTTRSWIWRCKGPQASEKDMKENIDAFLDGFQFEYVDKDESNVM